MADPFTGAAVGVLFAQLYACSSKLIKNCIDFEPQLGDLEKTLDALNNLIGNIDGEKRALHLPIQLGKNLKEDVVEGLKLVREYSEAGAVEGCWKKSTIPTAQIRKLNKSLRRQLEILPVHGVWITDETYSSKEPNSRNDPVCDPNEVEDHAEDPILIGERSDIDAESEPVEVLHMVVGGDDIFGGAAGGWRFNVLYDVLKELICKSMIYRRLLKDVLAALDSYRPLIKQIEANNEELGLPREEVAEFKAHLEKGIEIVRKCYKVRKWNINKKYEYANKLLGWDSALDKQLKVLQAQGVRDGKEILVWAKTTEKVLTRIETTSINLGAGVEDIETTSRHIEKMVGGVEIRSRDLVEGMYRIEKSNSNLEAGLKRIEDQLEAQNGAKGGAWGVVPDLTQFTVGLDEPLKELKMKPLKDGVSMLVVTAPGGCGKTTLATKFCQDQQVKDEFKNNIFFVTGSNTTNLSLIVQELYQRKGSQVPTFQDASMIKCSNLQELPPSVVDLDQLTEVICDDKTKHLWEAFLPNLTNTQIVVAKENLNLNEQGSREVEKNSDSITEEVRTSEVEEQSTSSIEDVVRGIEMNFGKQNQSETVERCPLPQVTQPIVGMAVPLKDSQNEILKDVNCSEAAHSASASNDDVLVPEQSTSPLKIPKLRTLFPPSLCQPQNKKKRLEHKTHILSSDDPTLLSRFHNASIHSQLMPSADSTITIEFCQERSSGEESIVDGQVRKHFVPVDLERYGKEESSHLSRAAMQDMCLAMQRFHVMSTRFSQSEERNAVLETSYRNAEESWKLENLKLSEQRNFAIAQVASLTKEKDSLAEKIRFLENNKVTARQEAQEILTKEWEPEFKREMQEAEKECFKLGCRVGFQSFLAKVESKFPNLHWSDIIEFEPIEFDMRVIKDLLSPENGNEADNDSDDDTNYSDEDDGNDEERGGNTVAEVPGDALERLYRFAMHGMIDGATITVDLEKEVLGVAKPMYILREDIMQFKEMTPISATCINVYMRHLNDVLKVSKIDGIFGFCEASSISVGTPDGKSQVLATRLQQLSTNRILLVPYNSGCHWTLTIISEEKDICYFMDPIHSLIDPREWKSVVNNGIEQWNYHQTGRSLQKRPVWKNVKGPKQPSHVECGYYVMRYMKEMVEDRVHSFATRWDSKKYFSAYKETGRAYTKTEVDEVQWEWASLVDQQRLRRR